MLLNLSNTGKMRKWQELYDDRPGRRIQYAGYTVTLFADGAVRYSEGNRHLTLLGEVVDETAESRWKWLIFPCVVSEVVLPRTLIWDDGTALPESESSLVIQRIKGVFKYLKEPLRLIHSDAPYVQLKKDLEAFGPKGS